MEAVEAELEEVSIWMSEIYNFLCIYLLDILYFFCIYMHFGANGSACLLDCLYRMNIQN